MHILLQGDVLFLMEDLDAASQIYHYALKVNNYSAEACFGLGKCYKAAEMSEDAKEMFELALQCDPNFAVARAELEGIKNN